MRNKQIIQHNE